MVERSIDYLGAILGWAWIDPLIPRVSMVHPMLILKLNYSQVHIATKQEGASPYCAFID